MDSIWLKIITLFETVWGSRSRLPIGQFLAKDLNSLRTVRGYDHVRSLGQCVSRHKDDLWDSV